MYERKDSALSGACAEPHTAQPVPLESEFTASTAHVAPHVLASMECGSVHAFTYENLDDGHLVYVIAKPGQRFPASLRPLVKLARAQGLRWLRLSRTGPVHPGLRTFEQPDLETA